MSFKKMSLTEFNLRKYKFTRKISSLSISESPTLSSASAISVVDISKVRLMSRRTTIVVDYSHTKDSETIHRHVHPDEKITLPHMHNQNDKRCALCVSGYDSHRLKRYYFTNEKTPVRVYVTYGEHQNSYNTVDIPKHLMANNIIQPTVSEHVLPNIKNNFKQPPWHLVSKKFRSDAQKMIYNNETRSFIPRLPISRTISTKAKTPIEVN